MNRRDGLDIKPVQHTDIKRPSVQRASSHGTSPLRQRSNLLFCQGVRFGEDIRATVAAEGPAPDLIAPDVVRQVLRVVDGELVVRGVNPNGAALGIYLLVR